MYALRSAPNRTPIDCRYFTRSFLAKCVVPLNADVLDEVREAELVVGLEHGAGVHDEPQLGALSGFGFCRM